MLVPVVLAAALMNAAMVAASAVSTILTADELGSSLAGVPNTAGVLGTAAGAIAVGRWTTRLGRAHALRLGYGVGVAGGALTVVAAVGAPVVLLFAGMFLLGAGNAASLLSRYAAGEAVPDSRRASAMSAVVWASTAGAAGGPFLLAPSQSFASALGLPEVAGPFLLAVAAVFGALVASTYIRTVHVAEQPAQTRLDRPAESRRTSVLLAAGVMIAGHLVMVALMSAVPVHTHHHGDGLGLLGLMLSAHTLGMFALSPLTGWWIDRSGPQPVMLAGLLLLIGSAVLTTQSGAAFTPALFLLGYAWNLCYLGGSARLLGTPFESKVESSIWAISALAAASSPWLYTLGGYPLLTVISVVLAVPLLLLVLRRTAPRIARS
ncbi:MFS transporter [Kribbella sp. VKM Ac-2566]|uniref:MFS transporter n=1 Tax=Kribbella sp. VKM Ac-2566 TaxID=2512218 RepID=UPI001062AF13|nr:MFS transporter [Kribbella sp. VKM Ac-2566]TDW80881.1 MFS transporter [Kribbella sp. VKM Ac-2566]